MLIKLTPSILNNTSEYLLLALENLAIAMREVKHLVIAETKTFKKIIEHPSFKELGLNSQNIYQELFNNNENYGAYLSYISQYIEIIEPCLIPTKIKRDDQTIIQVPLSFFEDSEMIQTTILLCENQEDTEFYEIIGRVYCHRKKLNNVSFKFTPQGGGGSTIASEYESIQSRQNRFCLCIVDSDKLSPHSSEGKTAKGLLEKHDLNSTKTELYILNAREAENLIPYSSLLSLLSKDPNKRNQYQDLRNNNSLVSSKIRLYIDIKDGTLLRELFDFNDQEIQKFWKEEIKKISSINERITFGCLETWKCQKINSCSFRIMPSFGANILKEILKEFKSNKTRLSDIVKQITDDQLLFSEWEKIGQIILNWGVVGRRIRA